MTNINPAPAIPATSNNVPQKSSGRTNSLIGCYARLVTIAERERRAERQRTIVLEEHLNDNKRIAGKTLKKNATTIICQPRNAPAIIKSASLRPSALC